MTEPLTLGTFRGGDGRLVLNAAGEIDLTNIDVFSRALVDATTEATASGAPLTVDFSAVEYLDSAAINALYNLAEPIHLIANPVLMRSLTVSGLAEVITIEASPTA
ncbi:STAS domain-containing protein [Mycolicibacterium gadium]|jgi:anti-anti-sigma factor|uniref:STAS domain-containing protein n=1 Tax=Mycolicibacterium gadium TaxID=1794 RepID=UPI002FDD8B5E